MWGKLSDYAHVKSSSFSNASVGRRASAAPQLNIPFGVKQSAIDPVLLSLVLIRWLTKTKESRDRKATFQGHLELPDTGHG